MRALNGESFTEWSNICSQCFCQDHKEGRGPTACRFCIYCAVKSHCILNWKNSFEILIWKKKILDIAYFRPESWKNSYTFNMLMYSNKLWINRWQPIINLHNMLIRIMRHRLPHEENSFQHRYSIQQCLRNPSWILFDSKYHDLFRLQCHYGTSIPNLLTSWPSQQGKSTNI